MVMILELGASPEAVSLFLGISLAMGGILLGMSAKLNQNECNRKRSKTTDNNGDPPSLSNLIPDVLFAIIMRLGVVDFIAFSGVCKAWRKIALENREMFMLSKKPMIIRISTRVDKKKECWLEDCDGRRFRTILPRSSGRTCVGLVSGYLVLFGRKTHDFRLVNPITRDELHFPRFPFSVFPDPISFTGALVFSRMASSWVFVIAPSYSRRVSVSYASKQARWTHLSSDERISDLIFFKGKIYTLSVDVGLCEVRLDHEPTLTPLITKYSVTSYIKVPVFATLGEQRLFAMPNGPKDPNPVEVDFDKMKWVVNKLELCEELHKPHDPYPRSGYVNRTDENKKTCVRNMWFSPHKCLDVNYPHE